MSIKRLAVKIGSIEHRPLDPNENPKAGEVEFIGVVVVGEDGRPQMVWDGAAMNIRPMTGVEVTAEKRATSPPVEKWQFKLEMQSRGLLAQLATYISAGDVVRRIHFEDRGEYRRNAPHIVAMFAALGIDDATADAIFTAARARK